MSLSVLGKRFAGDESGATAIEYGLIVGLIFLAITAAVNGFTEESGAMYSEIASNLANP
ncbi:MAG TPA: Flp family type IVb pilin [Parvularculaceae bacterium]|nr:Flp family type IVb pilin [Parvularculaceae bacterium]HNS86601.1 Flp family type IVb pilin [Parvularculaceae bacterium]